MKIVISHLWEFPIRSEIKPKWKLNGVESLFNLAHSNFALDQKFHSDGANPNHGCNSTFNFISGSKLFLSRLTKTGRVKNWNVIYTWAILIKGSATNPINSDFTNK